MKHFCVNEQVDDVNSDDEGIGSMKGRGSGLSGKFCISCITTKKKSFVNWMMIIDLPLPHVPSSQFSGSSTGRSKEDRQHQRHLADDLARLTASGPAGVKDDVPEEDDEDGSAGELPPLLQVGFE